MGQYVNRTDPKTGKSRKYYKADNGKLYNDYNAAASANMNPVARVQRWAGQVFGGSQEKPAVTQRRNEIERVMGVRPNIVDPSTNPITNAVYGAYTKLIGRTDKPDSANTFTNTMVMQNYQPGKKPLIETHEAGHLSNEQAGLPKYLGVAGRFLGNAVSDNLGNPAPLELLSGGLMMTMDANEEDRAERLTKKYGAQLGADPKTLPYIDKDGRSEYGNNIRIAGKKRIDNALSPILSPIQSAINTANQWRADHTQAGLQPQITDAVKKYRQLSSASDQVTPELMELDKQLKKYQNQYGEGFTDFVNTIK